jgi:hypothetical protein
MDSRDLCFTICRRCGRRRRCDDLPDAGDGVCAPAGGEETVVADAVEAVGQDMEQEAADKLVRRQRHGLAPVLAGSTGEAMIGLLTPLSPSG